MPYRSVALALVLLIGVILLWTWSSGTNPLPVPPIPPGDLSVRQFGARGDGETKDTAAFQSALDTAAKKGGGIVDVPAGLYLLGSLVMPSHVTLHLLAGADLKGSSAAADYPITTGRWEGTEGPVHQALISARNAVDLAITGQGTIEGSPAVAKLRKPRGPTLIEFVSCQQIRVQGELKLKNENVWTVHPVYCRDVAISGVNFLTHGRTSDCLVPDSSEKVHIDHCSFKSGDDCISLKSGRGPEGRQLNRPCEDITISNCRFNGGIGCVAIGSEVSGGIRRVAIRDCTFQKGLAALYIKTNDTRGGFIEDISIDHLQSRVPLLRVDTHYNSHPSTDNSPPIITSIARIRLADITVHSGNNWWRGILSRFFPKLRSEYLVKVEGDERRPLDGLELSTISGYSDRGIVIQNVNHLRLENTRVECEYQPPVSFDLDEMTDAANVPPAAPE